MDRQSCSSLPDGLRRRKRTPLRRETGAARFGM
jgi:hypothetical protein